VPNPSVPAEPPSRPEPSMTDFLLSRIHQLRTTLPTSPLLRPCRLVPRRWDAMSTSRLLHPLPAATASHSAICVMAAAIPPPCRSCGPSPGGRRIAGAGEGGRPKPSPRSSRNRSPMRISTGAVLMSRSTCSRTSGRADGRRAGLSDNGRWKAPARERPESAGEDLYGRGLRLVEAYAETVRIRQSSVGTSVTAIVVAAMCSWAGHRRRFVQVLP
jgi:hypothetical protein